MSNVILWELRRINHDITIPYQMFTSSSRLHFVFFLATYLFGNDIFPIFGTCKWSLVNMNAFNIIYTISHSSSTFWVAIDRHLMPIREISGIFPLAEDNIFTPTSHCWLFCYLFLSNFDSIIHAEIFVVLVSERKWNPCVVQKINLCCVYLNLKFHSKLQTMLIHIL